VDILAFFEPGLHAPLYRLKQGVKHGQAVRAARGFWYLEAVEILRPFSYHVAVPGTSGGRKTEKGGNHHERDQPGELS
jgi:hypothetical protein